MLFNSYPFIFLFLPITCVGALYIGSRSSRLAVAWLVGASTIFYGFWSWVYVYLLLFSILANYAFGRWIAIVQKTGSRYLNRVLILAISVNLLMLGYFKYCNFFIGSFVELFGGNFLPFNIILPLGISFFTFTQIGFLIDVSRGITHEPSLPRYLLFVTYFPHVIAGPLLHHKQVMPQFADTKAFRFNTQNISIGITIFILALAKKIFLADSFSEISDPIFNATSQSQYQPMLVESWIGAVAYQLQLYFDFSAYSEMALGISLMFNVRLPLNFNSPLKAKCMIEYWQRWHMSLTKYIYEYLYSPITTKFMRAGLGKTKVIEVLYTTVLPTMITFFIIGLWHGANWTFIVFGALHGMYMLINYSWRALKKQYRWRLKGAWYSACACLLTYVAVIVAAVFFRAETVSSALVIIKGMGGLNGISLPLTAQSFFLSLPFDVSVMGVVFNGFVSSQTLAMNPLSALLLLLIGQLIVWGLPNVHQIMSSYQIALEDLDRTKDTANSLTAPPFVWWVWRLTALRAVSVGLLFFSLVIVMATNKPSTFLYYQF